MTYKGTNLLENQFFFIAKISRFLFMTHIIIIDTYYLLCFENQKFHVLIKVVLVLAYKNKKNAIPLSCHSLKLSFIDLQFKQLLSLNGAVSFGYFPN